MSHCAADSSMTVQKDTQINGLDVVEEYVYFLELILLAGMCNLPVRLQGTDCTRGSPGSQATTSPEGRSSNIFKIYNCWMKSDKVPAERFLN